MITYLLVYLYWQIGWKYNTVASNDIELFQSFCRTYFNQAVKVHFKDIQGNDDNSLSRGIPRALIKRICLHKDTDPIALSIGRLLVWWVEARGLFDEYIYGIPATDFEIVHTYYPQVKLHFREDKYEAARAKRRPARSEVSFRWRESDYGESNIKSLANKIVSDFAKPIFSFRRGRLAFTYWDKEKAYRFTVYTNDEINAKKIIKQSIGIQDGAEPDWDKHLRKHQDGIDYDLPGTVRVMGKVKSKPKKRPIATVNFIYAELFIPGLTKPLVLVDRTGTKPGTIKIA
jgi:hypothetical protein